MVFFYFSANILVQKWTYLFADICLPAAHFVSIWVMIDHCLVELYVDPQGAKSENFLPCLPIAGELNKFTSHTFLLPALK